MKKFLLVCSVVISALPMWGNVSRQDSLSVSDNNVKNISDSWEKYVPDISGTLRARYEWEPEIGESRFLLRNARVILDGNVLPQIGYFLQVDFCNAGKITLLDAFAKFNVLDNQLKFTAGQMRLPFSIDTKRSPHLLYFSNRSFLAKYFGALSSVGVTAEYSPSSIPFYVEGGIFNSSSVDKQTSWNKRMTYVARMNYKFGGFVSELGFQSRIPDNIRLNLLNANLSWTYGNFFTEAEYMMMHYTNNSFKTAHAYTVMASYAFPISKFLNNISVQARWDGMSEQSSGIRNDEGKLWADRQAKNRITGGVTLSYLEKFGVDFRINYEKYLYKNDEVIIDDSERDKLVLEFIVHF